MIDFQGFCLSSRHPCIPPRILGHENTAEKPSQASASWEVPSLSHAIYPVALMERKNSTYFGTKSECVGIMLHPSRVKETPLWRTTISPPHHDMWAIQTPRSGSCHERTCFLEQLFAHHHLRLGASSRPLRGSPPRRRPHQGIPSDCRSPGQSRNRAHNGDPHTALNMIHKRVDHVKNAGCLPITIPATWEGLCCIKTTAKHRNAKVRREPAVLCSPPLFRRGSAQRSLRSKTGVNKHLGNCPKRIKARWQSFIRA